MNISNSQVNRLRHFVRAGLRSLFRPEPQTAVEWADANYYLPKESAYQEGRWETLPFQRAIMNAMGSDYIREVNVVKSARVLGKLSANQIEGDLVKTVGKAFPRDSRAPERWPSGTITVRVYDDQPFDRQIVIPAVAFSGAKHEQDHTDIYSSCRLIVRKNGAEIYNRTALDNTLIYTGVIDMPAGSGVMTLEFSVSAWLVNNWYPTASISDLLVVVMKKATAGISIS